MAPADGPLLAFGEFVFDPQACVLRRAGEPVRLQPKTFDLLHYLLRHPLRVLDKDELLAAVWPGVVVTDHSLTRAIKDLRRALQDDAAAPRYIDTVARRGYRFMLEPQPLSPAPAVQGRARASDVQAVAPPAVVAPSAPSRARLGRLAWPAAFLGLLVLLLGVALWQGRMGSQEAAPVASIAVLPFVNLTPSVPGVDEGAARALADGVAEDLLDRLGQVPRMQVVARTSSFSFREQSDDVKRIGRALGVAWVLEGSVRTDGERVLIATQLVDTRTGYRAWSTRLERPLADLFAMQDEIARNVAIQVMKHIDPGVEFPDAHRSAGVEAWKEYMLARELFSRRTQDWRPAARAALQRALALEPDFGRALALQAIVDILEAEHAPQRDALHRAARDGLQRALAVDPRLGLAHAAQGLLHLQRNEWAQADRALSRALELDPQLSAAYNWRHIAFNSLGKPEEAQALLSRALQLDPLNPTLRSNLAAAYEREGREALARQELLRLLELPARPQGATASLLSLDTDYGRLAEALRWALMVERDGTAHWGPVAGGSLLPVLARLELHEPLALRLAAFEGRVVPVPMMRRLHEALLRQGRLEDFERLAQALLTQPSGPPQRFWALRTTSLALRGRLDEALAAQVMHGRVPVREGLRELADMLSALAWARLQAGDPAQRAVAQADLARLIDQGEAGELGRSPQVQAEQAMHRALSGQIDAALQQLEAAVQAGFNDHLWLLHDPRWTGLQAHPRFVAVQQAAARSAAAERAIALVRMASDPAYAGVMPTTGPRAP